MDSHRIKKLAEKVADLQGQACSLHQEVMDFPALERNLVRVEASLRVMLLELGEFTLINDNNLGGGVGNAATSL